MYQRPVWVEVDLEVIRKNTALFKKIIGPKTLLMVVVKADGYGHGARVVAEAVLEAGADRLGVALPEEGVELRQAGLKAPIQILSEIPAGSASLVLKHDLIATICSKKVAEELSSEAKKSGKKAKIHLKVDTGMNRIGFFPEQVISFLKYTKNLSFLELEGIFTHFAYAYEPNNSYTQEQFRKFKDLLEELEEKGYQNLLKHAANSAATLLFPETHLDMVRIGISLYGLHPSEATKTKFKLIPALSLKAKVSFVKTLESGQGISYGLTYKTPRKTNIVTLPLGYGDGYSRLLSNMAQVLVRGKRFPIVGTISMDQLMVDVGKTSAQVGEEAVLIGKQGSQEISVDEIAKILRTINYEVVCMISKRVPRIYKTSGK